MESSTEKAFRWRTMAQALAALALAAYPLLVWRGLAAGRPRAVALILLLALAPAIASRARRGSPIAFLPWISAALLALGGLLGELGFVTLVPTAINATLLVTFGASLRAGAMPMVEGFARLQEPELDEAQRAWCRSWTLIWSSWFAFNGTVATLLAWRAPLSLWALYNGLVAYLLMGVLFAVEWSLRARRFPRASRGSVPNEAP